MNDQNNNGSAPQLRDGVSIRVNGQSYGAQKAGPDVIHSAPVQATVRGTSNAVTTYVPFDETFVGDLEGVQPFADVYERTAAMRDPRYAQSPAFRNYVRQRLAAELKQRQG